MKKILVTAVLAVAATGAMAAEPAYTPPAPLCTTERSIVIKDAQGNVMDSIKYENNWPLDCFTRLRLRYELLESDVTQGKAQFNQLMGQ